MRLKGTGLGQSSKRGRGSRRAGIALVGLSVLLLAIVGTVAWFYFSFTHKVSAANGKVDSAIQAALDTPPPTTLVTLPAISPDDKPDMVMNMLVLGSDARAGVVEGDGSSDVVMLVHIDTRTDYFSILSITRDLYVTIPGYGKDRVNAAYNHGGPALTIATIKQNLGIDVTKYIGVGFEAFPGLIDSLGGVYVDVDRRYEYSDWWKFDLEPGYRRLDGESAFLYSRFRFDSNADFGRMARQQRILAGLRDQARGWDKRVKLPSIVNTIMDAATTNLSAETMLKLAYWLVKLDGTRMKHVVIEGRGQTIDGKAVVVADQAAITQAVADFLTPPTEGPAETGPAPSDQAGSGESNLLLAAGEPAVRLALAGSSTTVSARIRDAASWKAAQQSVPFRLEAPISVPAGFTYAGTAPKEGGTYEIVPGDRDTPAFRVLYRYGKSDLYLGISATTWLKAPLATEGTAVEHNGTVYTVCGTFESADHVWWKRDGVLYWVSNTLMYSLTGEDLLSIAESMRPVNDGD